MSFNENEAIFLGTNVKKHHPIGRETMDSGSRESTDTEKQKLGLPCLNPVWVNIPTSKTILRLLYLNE